MEINRNSIHLAQQPLPEKKLTVARFILMDMKTDANF